MEVNYFHPDVEWFLESLDKIVRTRVDRTIHLLSEGARYLTMPDSKKLEKDLYELRIRSIQNIRIFYTFYKDQIILLRAVNKKSQKLKMKDLEVARGRLKLLHSS